MKLPLLPLFVLMLVMTGCDIRYFSTGANGEINGRVLTRPYQNVIARQSSFILSPGSGVALEYSDRTEYRINVFVRSVGGESSDLELGLRSTVEEELVKDSGIVARIKRNSSSVRYNGEVLAETESRMAADSIVIIGLYSDDHYMRLNVGCDTVLQAHIPHIESDNLTLYNRGSSPIEILGVYWSALR